MRAKNESLVEHEPVHNPEFMKKYHQKIADLDMIDSNRAFLSRSLTHGPEKAKTKQLEMVVYIMQSGRPMSDYPTMFSLTDRQYIAYYNTFKYVFINVCRPKLHTLSPTMLYPVFFLVAAQIKIYDKDSYSKVTK
jgi:hypothetical protein